MSNTILKLTKPHTKIDSISPAKCLYAFSIENKDYQGSCVDVEETDSNVIDSVDFAKYEKIDQGFLTDHCKIDSGVVSKWYDQKEFSDAIQSTSSNRPRIYSGGSPDLQNGEACIVFDGTNDHLVADLPYADDESVVSIVVVYTPTHDNDADIILATDDINSGILILRNASNKIAVQTKRSGATNTSTSTSTVLSGDTIVIGVVVDRTNIKVYINGVLETTGTDDNSDFLTSTDLHIGYSTSLLSSMKLHFLGFWLTDESANMAEYHTQLSTRNDSSIENDNDSEWFSDYPQLLSNGIFAQGRLTGNTTFSENIKTFAWTSRPQGGFGTIDIVNIDSIVNYLVDGGYNKATIYDYEDSVLEEFGKGEIKSLGYAEKGRVRVSLKSEIDKLNTPLPTGVFNSTYPDLENDKKLMVLGNCYLVEPRLLDVTTNAYFVADYIHNIVTDYDQGISVSFTQTSNGFTLASNPVGRILVSCQGHYANTGTGYENHISQHIPRLLRKIDIEYDATSLSSIFSGIASQWSGTDESVQDAITDLLHGSNAFMYSDSEGVLQFGELEDPSGKAIAAYLYEREIIGDIIALPDTAQGLCERLKLDKNYNPYNADDIVFGATDSDKVNLIKDYRRTSILTGLHEFYKNKNIYMKSQALGGFTNGDTILQAIIDLWSEIRYFYTFSTNRTFDLNQVIELTHSEKGLESGKNMTCVSKEKQTNSNKIKYTFWG